MDTHWGLKTSEWITIAAIVLGPILAVATQLWMQSRKEHREDKLWVFETLMSFRATWIAPGFVRALNSVNVVFYDNKGVTDKLQELVSTLVLAGNAGDNFPPELLDKCKDLLAEMLAKMGKELGFEFDHTQIKDTAYYPRGHEILAASEFALREKGIAVLEGRANIGVVLRTEPEHSESGTGSEARVGR
jgi:hypothetical protein